MGKKIRLKPVFVKTKNVRNFQVMMDGLELSEGEGRFGMVFSSAGRGKTRTSQWYAANNRCVYLRASVIWRTSELGFLQALCKELGIIDPPRRKGGCFNEIVDILLADPLPVFVDEIAKLPRFFLDLVLDISEISTAPFILIGEENLVRFMQDNKRVWSRTFQQLQFDPITESDIIIYSKESTRLSLTPQIASLLCRSSSGDFRIIKRDLLSLYQDAEARGVSEVTEEMAKIAIKKGLKGA